MSTSIPFNVPGRAFTEPSTGMGTYSHFLTKSSSILTKRADFYRKYLSEKGYSPYNHLDIVASPLNPSLNIIRSNFQITDPLLLGLESSGGFSRAVTPLLKSFTQYSYAKSVLTDLENFTPSNLQKNQYRPMRKGITNMVRLHATGAVSIPTEIRIHILASSKDVIHSWAIPSAGIKIDCIPGYSSHRITIFFNSGIY